MESKWTNEIRARLESVYADKPKVKPGHEPAGIQPKEPRETRQISPQREDQAEGVHGWVSGTQIE